jgi:hypothetical protein
MLLFLLISSLDVIIDADADADAVVIVIVDAP